METRDSLLEKLMAKVKEDKDFRDRLLTNPNSALEEAFEIKIPDDFNVVVHQEDSSTAHLVLPAFAELTDSQLQQAAGGGGNYCYGPPWY